MEFIFIQLHLTDNVSRFYPISLERCFEYFHSGAAFIVSDTFYPFNFRFFFLIHSVVQTVTKEAMHLSTLKFNVSRCHHLTLDPVHVSDSFFYQHCIKKKKNNNNKRDLKLENA